MSLTLRERLKKQFQTAITDSRVSTTAETPAVEATTIASSGEHPAGVPVDLIGDPIVTPVRQNPRSGNGSMSTGETKALSMVDQLKVDLHRRLVERLDMEALEAIKDEKELASQIRDAVTMFLAEEQAALSQAERDEIIEQIVYEVTGLGPIEPLFRDATISDILVNGPRDIYVERRGTLSRVSTTFRNDAHLLAVIDRIVSRVGRRVDESSPMVDARLPDGSRVNAIIPPLAIDGPILSIRRFGAGLSIEQLIAHGAMSKSMAMFLAGCVRAKVNILISGGTGSGKTTLLNALSSFIPATERIITVEDAAELQLQQDHVVRLETRPPNVEGRGEVVARDLIRNALRMRPNRIIVGEVRSSEVIDMLQAMNTGHEGSLATIHANTPRDALARLETMALMAGTNLPLKAMREQIAAAIDIIVQVARLSDGTRRVVSITEVSSLKEEMIASQEIFLFDRQGVQEGHVIGRFVPTGLRPSVMERLELSGIALPIDVFDDTAATDDPEYQTRTAVADPQWAHVVGGLAAFDAASAVSAQQAEKIVELERVIAEDQRQLALLLDQAAVADALSESLRRDVAERETAVAESEATIARQQTEIEALRARVAELEKPREVRIGALLAFVDATDRVYQEGRQLGDEAWQNSLEQSSGRLHALLSAIGLEPIGAAGEPVDQSIHEVPASVDVASIANPVVANVVRRGFRVGDRVVRRARVQVAPAADAPVADILEEQLAEAVT